MIFKPWMGYADPLFTQMIQYMDLNCTRQVVGNKHCSFLARLNFWIADNAGVDGDKPVSQDLCFVYGEDVSSVDFCEQCDHYILL